MFVPGANDFRAGKVGLVRAGYAGKAAVSLIDVGELELADDHPAAHDAIGILIMLRSVKDAARRAVHDQSFGALTAGQHKGRMVHFQPRPKSVQIGNELLVHQEVAKGLAVRRIPLLSCR